MVNKLFELLNQLESDSSDNRKYAIEEIGIIGTDVGVRSLIHIANGNARTYKSRNWKNLWFKIADDCYGLEDQLAAIQSLAETGHRRAQFYIKSLTECIVTDIYDGANYGQGWSDVYSGYEVCYSNLNGELRKIATIDRSGNPIVRTSPGSHKKNTSEYLPPCREKDIILCAQERIEETIKLKK